MDYAGGYQIAGLARSWNSEPWTFFAMRKYKGFGPTLAAQCLAKKHGIEVSKETMRSWMRRAGLWRAEQERVRQVHVWRKRRERFGELVQWDTSDHDWLEGRGELRYLITLIDDATSRVFSRFV